MRTIPIALMMTSATQAGAYGFAEGKGNAAEKAIKALGHTMSSKHTSNTSKLSPSSTKKRKNRLLASVQEQRQFAKEFGTELIISFPGLSGPTVKPLTTVDKKGK